MSTFIMRWNPSVSNFRMEDYVAAINEWPGGMCGNWDIHDWESACDGDRFIMVRVGDDGPNGVIFHGEFISDPKESSDSKWWGKKKYYVDITVEQPCDPNYPCIPIGQLEALLPEIDWRKGPSGVLMSKRQERRFWEKFDWLRRQV